MDDRPFELWYKKPGTEEYIKIDVALDEIFNRLSALEGKPEDDNGLGLTD
jgi:hypothetical protein